MPRHFVSKREIALYFFFLAIAIATVLARLH